MTEQTITERSKLLDKTILPYNAQKRLSRLGFEVAKMETSGWKAEPAGREGIKLSKTDKGEKGSIKTEIHAYEDQIVVRRIAEDPENREVKRVQITQTYSENGEPKTMSLSLVTKPTDEFNEFNERETFVSWNPPREADTKEWKIDPGKCSYTKGRRTSSMAIPEQDKTVIDSLLNWGFEKDFINIGIPLEPENLLINTVRQSIKYPEDFFTPMVVLISRLPQP